MARPTEWSDDVEAQAWKYLEHYQDYGHAVPSVVGLCSVLNRGKSTLYTWAQDDTKGFRDILAAINESQERVAVDMGLKGLYNATIVKLLLGKHGYHDKSDATVSGPDGGPVEFRQIERTIVKAPNPNG